MCIENTGRQYFMAFTVLRDEATAQPLVEVLVIVEISDHAPSTAAGEHALLWDTEDQHQLTTSDVWAIVAKEGTGLDLDKLEGILSDNGPHLEQPRSPLRETGIFRGPSSWQPGLVPIPRRPSSLRQPLPKLSIKPTFKQGRVDTVSAQPNDFDTPNGTAFECPKSPGMVTEGDRALVTVTIRMSRKSRNGDRG
ncbi:hypothetical protein RRG08_044513 [Elysia crispata]|uniref:Uncharacterized protein n=1 Tax=Elysia crispata TaxID=231223 RepID=A0AAE1DDD8_9GAST|nr:hypothetical protein RRG08_044513 [Elysia crispata]